MNKKILAAAALAIVSGSAMADGAQLYGILDVSVGQLSNVGSTKNLNETAMGDGLWLPSVWGIKGSEDLGDGMSTHYNLESNLTVTSGDSTVGGALSLFGRAANVGIKGDFGDITAGQRLDPIWIQSVGEQAMGVRHVGSAGIATGVGVNYQNPGSTAALRNGNTTLAVFGSNWLYYDAPKLIDNVTISAGYQFGNAAGSTTADSGSYLGATYSKNGLTVNLGAETQNNGTGPSNSNNKVNRYLLGAMYTFGDFTVEAQEMRVSSSGVVKGGLATGYVDAQIGQTGIAYNISPKLQVGAQYVWVNDNYLNSRPTLTTIGAKYALSKRTSFYAVVENSQSASANAADGSTTTLALPVGYSPASAGGNNFNSNASLVAVGMFHTF
jgi:predicted porin